VSDYEGATSYWTGSLGTHFGAGPTHELGSYYWWFGSSFVLYLVIPCAWTKAFGPHQLGELGFGLGNRRLGLAISGGFLAIMIPVVLVASRFQAFHDEYPLCKEALGSRATFFTYEVGYALYFIAWEFLFRGYLLQGLKHRLGGGMAVLMQTLPFALMHSGKPEAEAYGSIVAGLALGVLALQTGSFWYGAGIHGVIAVTMDLVSAWGRVK
jgi:uncharacterized protein